MRNALQFTPGSRSKSDAIKNSFHFHYDALLPLDTLYYRTQMPVFGLLLVSSLNQPVRLSH